MNIIIAQNNGFFNWLKHNDLWDTNFWGRTEFGNVEHVQTELPLFESYCRHRRPLPEFDGQTADLLYPDFKPVRLPPDFDLHLQKRMAIRTGFVHFIRFVSPMGNISILNEIWSLDKNRWVGATVRATIDTQAQQLNIYHHPVTANYCASLLHNSITLWQKVLCLLIQPMPKLNHPFGLPLNYSIVKLSTLTMSCFHNTESW
ncbi:MAG: hypothetical protein JW953_06945 [Anaerolineae bacterium]|nr:hypothetical protein [Anaerolineae bacterium]